MTSYCCIIINSNVNKLYNSYPAAQNIDFWGVGWGGGAGQLLGLLKMRSDDDDNNL